MAKLGSQRFKGTTLVHDSLYIEIRIEKMVEVRVRFFFMRILIWLLKKIGPCKVELKYYEQGRTRSKDRRAKGRTGASKRN